MANFNPIKIIGPQAVNIGQAFSVQIIGTPDTTINVVCSANSSQTYSVVSGNSISLTINTQGTYQITATYVENELITTSTAVISTISPPCVGLQLQGSSSQCTAATVSQCNVITQGTCNGNSVLVAWNNWPQTGSFTGNGWYNCPWTTTTYLYRSTDQVNWTLVATNYDDLGYYATVFEDNSAPTGTCYYYVNAAGIGKTPVISIEVPPPPASTSTTPTQLPTISLQYGDIVSINGEAIFQVINNYNTFTLNYGQSNISIPTSSTGTEFSANNPGKQNVSITVSQLTSPNIVLPSIVVTSPVSVQIINQPTLIYLGSQQTFTATISANQSGGSIQYINVTFNNSTQRLTYNNAPLTVTFNTPTSAGTYNLSATATQQDGETGSNNVSIQISLAVPQVSISNYPEHIKIGSQFNATITQIQPSGTISSIQVIFNGSTTVMVGSVISLIQPNTIGTFTLTAIQTQSNGETAQQQVSITTQSPIQMIPISIPTVVNLGQTFTVKIQAYQPSGSISGMQGSFNNTTLNVSGPTFSQSFTQPTTQGTYTLNITATQQDGETQTFQQQILVANLTPNISITKYPKTTEQDSVYYISVQQSVTYTTISQIAITDGKTNIILNQSAGTVQFIQPTSGTNVTITATQTTQIGTSASTSVTIILTPGGIFISNLIDSIYIIKNNLFNFNKYKILNLNRFDFKRLLIQTQQPIKYIRNTLYQNNLDLYSYWTKFIVYDIEGNEIDPSTYTFTLSNNSQVLGNTSIENINNLDPNNLLQTNEIVNIYNSCLAVQSADNNPVSLTLTLPNNQIISKIMISHIPDNRTYILNTVEISSDGVNWNTIYNQNSGYPETINGKTFYFFSYNNILFTNLNTTIMSVENPNIVSTIQYVFNPDNNFASYLISDSLVQGYDFIPSKLYMLYSENVYNFKNLVYNPIQEIQVDFENTDYSLQYNDIYTQKLRFIFSPNGQNINEIEVYDPFGTNLILTMMPSNYSNNLQLNPAFSSIYNFESLTDGVIHDPFNYTSFLITDDNNPQYIDFDLGREYKIQNIKIYFQYSNINSPIYNIIHDFICQYYNGNEWVDIYNTTYDGIFPQTQYGKNLINYNLINYSPIQPLNAQYIKYLLNPTNTSNITFTPILPIFENSFLPNMFNYNDFHIAFNNLILSNDNTLSNINLELVDYSQSYNITLNSNQYIMLTLPYIMKLQQIQIPSQIQYSIKQIWTSSNSVVWNKVYDNTINNPNTSQLNQIQTYKIINYASDTNYGLLYDNNWIPNPDLILGSGESYFQFNNVGLFVNKNKLLILKQLLFNNSVNQQNRFLLQTQNLNVQYNFQNGQLILNYNTPISSQTQTQTFNLYTPDELVYPIYISINVQTDNTFTFYYGSTNNQQHFIQNTFVGLNGVYNTNDYIIIGNQQQSTVQFDNPDNEIYPYYLYLLNYSDNNIVVV